MSGLRSAGLQACTAGRATALRYVCLLVIVSGSSAAAQWPQWRGPSRNGTVAAASTLKWPASPQGWKRAWRVEVGEGYSSPVVSGGRVFVHSRRDPEEIVRDASGVMRLTP